MSNLKLSAKAQEALGLPAGYKTYSPFPFGGMNQQASRVAIDDQEFYWLENMMRIGSARLRTTPDKGPARFSSSKTIIEGFSYNLGGVSYHALFFSDGTAVQLNPVTTVTTPISNIVGTFYQTGAPLPAKTYSGHQYLVIANNFGPNNYWLWDGAILYTAGGVSPIVTVTDGGSGYTSPPLVSIIGGHGSGATFLATIEGGSVVSIQVLTPGTGYQPGDFVQLIINGGGTDSGAGLNANLAPQGVAAVNVTDPGEGYTGIPTVTFTGGGPPSTGQATGHAVMSADGKTVAAVVVDTPGTGYTATPTVTFSGGLPSGGTKAKAVALLTAGSVASVSVDSGGTGYVGTPTLTFVGGGGIGAAGVAVMSGGAIASVTMTNGGTGYTDAPLVVVESGQNNGAAATVELMPYGVSGSAIENYQTSMYLTWPWQSGSQQNSGRFLKSAPGSLTDFATSDGGLIFTATDTYSAAYVNIKQSNGYLYPMSDSAIEVISNVQTSAATGLTTFTYQITDTQIGLGWRDTVQDFSKSILFANVLGVYGLYGGTATKISGKVDDLFRNAVFPPTSTWPPPSGIVIPSSAVAEILNMRVYLILMTITDPFTFQPRTVMLGWNEQDWFVCTQTAGLTYIWTEEINTVLTAYGTDGTSVWALFQTPSGDLVKRITTKLYGSADMFIAKNAMALYIQGQDNSSGLTGISMFTKVDASGFTPQVAGLESVQNGSYTFENPVTFAAPPPYWPMFGTEVGGIPGYNLGLDFLSNSVDFTISNISLGYVDIAGKA